MVLSWLKEKFYRPVKSVDTEEPMRYEISPHRNRLLRFLRGTLPFRKYRLVTSERIVEIPFAYRHLIPPPATVLDFGCARSTVAISLASLGYRVTGIDLRRYAFAHPNLKFVQANMLTHPFAENTFDAITAISTVEHCGLGAYAESEVDNGDCRVMEELLRILKPGGQLILTVPFGSVGATSWYRIYDQRSLQKLTAGFTVRVAQYYSGVGRTHWVPVAPEALAPVDSAREGYAYSAVQGVACLSLEKPRARAQKPKA